MDNVDELEDNVHIYREKQGIFDNNCGLHALNNLVGARVFEKKRLDDICKMLSPKFINPHKHIFGGDYDVNILMIALQEHKMECSFVDNRKESEFVQRFQQIQKQLVGFIINNESKGSVFQPFLKKVLQFSGRHWTVIKKIDQKYYFLDSNRKSQKSQFIQNIEEFILTEMEKNSSVLFVRQAKGQLK